MAKIFISHSSADKSFARKLSEDLKTAGHDPWLDEWEVNVGDCIVSKISDGIQDAKYVVLVLTPDATNSRWVDEEWKAAYWTQVQAAEVTVLPLLLQRCKLPPLLASKKYADFSARYEIGFSQLLKATTREGEIVDNIVTPHDPEVVFRKGYPEILTLKFEFMLTGKVVEVEVASILQAGELKRLLVEEMALSDQFLDGRVASSTLYSKTREKFLSDAQSLVENGVLNNETLRIVYSACAG